MKWTSNSPRERPLEKFAKVHTGVARTWELKRGKRGWTTGGLISSGEGTFLMCEGKVVARPNIREKDSTIRLELVIGNAKRGNRIAKVILERGQEDDEETLLQLRGKESKSAHAGKNKRESKTRIGK